MNFSNEDLIFSDSPTFHLIETVEHLQAISGLDEAEWLNLLKTSWSDYYFFRSGQKNLPLQGFENLAQFFNFQLPKLDLTEIDFHELSSQRLQKKVSMPDYYMVAAHGRLRSTITAIDFLEAKYGWRLRHDLLKHFGVSEASLENPFSQISIRFITEICEYLRRRQFSAQDFFAMGAFSYENNRHSLIGKLYSEMSNYKEAFDAFAKTLMPMFEQNCTYQFDMLDSVTGIVTVKSNSDIAAELKVKHLGSEHLCQFKAGAWASLTAYFGLTLPKVTHPQCEHRGDGVCRFVFDFSNCRPSSASQSKPGPLRN